MTIDVTTSLRHQCSRCSSTARTGPDVAYRLPDRWTVLAESVWGGAMAETEPPVFCPDCSAAVRGVIDLLMPDGDGVLLPLCEGCWAPLQHDDDRFYDSEGGLFCHRCRDDFLADTASDAADAAAWGSFVPVHIERQAAMVEQAASQLAAMCGTDGDLLAAAFEEVDRRVPVFELRWRESIFPGTLTSPRQAAIESVAADVSAGRLPR